MRTFQVKVNIACKNTLWFLCAGVALKIYLELNIKGSGVFMTSKDKPIVKKGGLNTVQNVHKDKKNTLLVKVFFLSYVFS